MKSGIEKVLIFGIILFGICLFCNQGRAENITINEEILSDTYEIDTSAYYIYDTSVYQIPVEQEYYTLWKFISRFENAEIEHYENLPQLNYITYDRATSDSINIRLETEYEYYYEKPARKVKVNYRKVEVK